jgi:hypothetical protein
LQFPSAQKHADGDESKAQQKQGRRDQKENDAKIGIVGEVPEDFGYPVADHRHAGRGGDGAAGEADGVVAEKSAGRIQLSRNLSNNDTFPQPP